MARVEIPVSEFKERVQRAAELIRERGLDVLVVNGSEADYADTRYFSNFWRVAIAPLWWDRKARSLLQISA